MITYSQLLSHVRPFFLSRGGDSLAGNERMLFYANCALQDVYNNDSATFTYKIEQGIVPQPNDASTAKFTLSHNLRKVQECVGYRSDGSSVSLTPTLFLPKDDYDSCWVRFESGSNVLITDVSIVKIDVTYVREYEWVSSTSEMLAKPIQVPDRYVPAVVKLMYDWASPVNLMSGESSTTDFFSHARTRMKELSDDDSLTDLYRLNSAY